MLKLPLLSQTLSAQESPESLSLTRRLRHELLFLTPPSSGRGRPNSQLQLPPLQLGRSRAALLDVLCQPILASALFPLKYDVPDDPGPPNGYLFNSSMLSLGERGALTLNQLPGRVLNYDIQFSQQLFEINIVISIFIDMETDLERLIIYLRPQSQLQYYQS